MVWLVTFGLVFRVGYGVSWDRCGTLGFFLWDAESFLPFFSGFFLEFFPLVFGGLRGSEPWGWLWMVSMVEFDL